MKDSVFYEELAPKEFRERIAECPVGYVPLGTIEWHNEHLPLGTDIIRGGALFEIIAREVGGIVFPPLFLGPDREREKDGITYYGMDVYETYLRCPPYPLTRFPGSCYHVSDELYQEIVRNVARQAARAGFRILFGIGHGPSTSQFAKLSDEMYAECGIRLLNLRDGTGISGDHAAKYETSDVMYLRPELVHMDRLSEDPDDFPKGVSGDDPRTSASASVAEAHVPVFIEHVRKVIEEYL